jgi:hypothetical protein
MPDQVRPALSIVIAAWHGADALGECLTALAAEPGLADTEVLVCRAAPLVPAGWVKDRLGAAQEVVLPAGTSVPQLRAEGVRRAGGIRVALLEDHCPVRPGWLQALRSGGLEAPGAVLGGPVSQARDARSATSWAVYLQDYLLLAPPLRPGASPMPSGCNASLSSALLDQLEPVWCHGVYEASLWAAIRAAGVPTVLLEGLGVEHRGRYRFGWAVAQAWHHGRLFGAWRDAEASSAIRWGRLATGAILLVWLPVRTIFRLAGRRLEMGRVLLSLPILVLLLWVWAAGEGWGTMAGSGRSWEAWG